MTTFGGLFHLIGETLQVCADGARHPDCVVDENGVITFVRDVTTVQVGFAYNSDAQMLRLEAGAADGTAQGKTQRTHLVAMRLHDSLELKTGRDFDHLYDQQFGVVALFSGDLVFQWEGNYTNENYICWRWSHPLPGTILAVMPQLHTQDR